MLPTDTDGTRENAARPPRRADGGESGTDGPDTDDGTTWEPFGSTESERIVSQAELLEILGNRRRRLLWALLHRRDDRVDLADASRRVAARERGIDPGAVASEERKSVYASLYQHHCPVMAEAGVIEFDREASTVAAVEAAERQRFLDLEVDSRPVARAIAGSLAAAAGAVGVGWALDAPLLASLSAAEFGVSVAVSAAVSVAVYAAVVSRRYPVRLADLLRAADGPDR
ncbi:DUF7344 domain-containing protein [Halorubrum sp. AS12]|uniref:DUF7344 domain-containing protein n=1 Tax=Halorubrum sp. AS12 TaxID=3409687 RepID=UPI003DA72A7C